MGLRYALRLSDGSDAGEAAYAYQPQAGDVVHVEGNLRMRVLAVVPVPGIEEFVDSAAGLEHRRIYDCRHTFATWAIESGVHLWHLATIMGTSVVQLEDTYARWLKRTDQIRSAFDNYDAGEALGQ